MGFFKKPKAMINSAQGMQTDVQVMTAEVNQPVDLNDPIWAPIEGVDLDRYAQIGVAMMRQSLVGVEQVEAWVETQGVQPGTWGKVQRGWAQRMAGNMQLRNHYGVLYSQLAG